MEKQVIWEHYLPQDKRVRMVILMLVDICIICLASFLGLFIRFDMSIPNIPEQYVMAAQNYLAAYVCATIVIFWGFRLYTTMWSVAGIREIFQIIAACGAASLIQIAGMMFLDYRVPRSYYLISFASLCGMEILARLSYRIFSVLINNGFPKKRGNGL